MGVEAGTQKDEFGSDLVRGFLQGVAEDAAVVGPRGSVLNRDVKRSAEPLAGAGFVGGAGAGIEAVAEPVDAVEDNVRIFIEDVLGAVAVTDVPVDDEDAI